MSTGDRLTADVVVVGGGIVGLATARAIQSAAPGVTVVVVEKEDAPALHQTGRNSGVVHSGVYYTPGSAKATLVARGRRELIEHCRSRGLPLQRCGKVIVATHPAQMPGLHALAQRAAANGVEAHLVDAAGLRAVEPHAAGMAALHVPDVYVCDFAAVARSLADELVGRDGAVMTGAEVTAIATDVDGAELTTLDGRTVRARVLVNCAGLHSDRIARLAGLEPAVRIMPFRGEYHRLAEDRAHLVSALIYPLPDPRYPFLGVHLTRMVDGTVHAGPNAVPAFAREGYTWGTVAAGEVATLLRDPGARRLARRYWRTGAAEIVRSLSRRRFAAAARRLVPELRAADLEPDHAGVRAQALAADGTLVDDFVFVDGPRSVHVLNAPSPAATASPAIGAVVAERAVRLLGR